jgi:hypothetical protein
MAELITVALLLFFAYVMVKLTLSLVSLLPAVIGIALLLWIMLYWPLTYVLAVLVLILLVLRYFK